MRNPFSSSTGSWQTHKNEGKQAYDSEDYERALRCYAAALNPELEAPRQEQQILLSNIVACRLKIGGQEELAVRDAKKCVEINPSWSKGHVRLASAYIALGGHSNDACNELQTALRLDSGNSTARDMLIRELRRDHSQASASPPPPQNPDFTDSAPTNNDAVDDSFSLTERFNFYVDGIKSWYASQPGSFRMLVKAVTVILVLYIVFGGRFGMERPAVRGNYGSGNVYDRYRHRAQQSRYQAEGRYDRYGDRHHHEDSYNYNYRQRNNYSAKSFSDGTIPWILMVGAVLYVCHLNGINPLQALFMMNMLGGRRRRGFYYGGGMGGFGMGGFGYGGRRMRFGRRRW